MTQFERKRRAAGLTRQKIADKLGVTARAVGKWELDIAIPSPVHFPKLAKLFGMTPEELTHIFDGQTKPPRSARRAKREAAAA